MPEFRADFPPTARLPTARGPCLIRNEPWPKHEYLSLSVGNTLNPERKTAKKWFQGSTVNFRLNEADAEV